MHYGTLSACYKYYLQAQGQSPAFLPLLMCLSAPLDAFQNCQAQVQAWCPDGRAECHEIIQHTQHKHAKERRPARRVENRHAGTTLSASHPPRICSGPAAPQPAAGCRHCRQAQCPTTTQLAVTDTHLSLLCAPRAVPDAQSPGGPCSPCRLASSPCHSVAGTLTNTLTPVLSQAATCLHSAGAACGERHALESEGAGQITNSASKRP